MNEAKNIMTNLDSILNELKNSDSLLSCKGMKKESVYKAAMFADAVTSDDKKLVRRKLRNLTDSFLKSYLSYQNDQIQVRKLYKDFSKVYVEVFNVNDYSVSSICSKNTDDQKIKMLSKMMGAFKIIHETESKKSNK